MDEVQLEAYFGHCWDYITFYNGATTSSPTIGSGQYCTTPTSSTVTSTGSSVLVVFTSDESVNTGKFSLRWTFADTGGDGGEFSIAFSFTARCYA